MIIKTTTTTTIEFNRLPNTICNGFIDVHGKWNNGFACPIENLIQYFCCGTDNYRYCCSSDRYSFETRLYINSNYSRDYSERNHKILTDEINLSLINNEKLINKQFEQFEKYFLPIFLLTTTILFLVGIALWFWLYKHKTFYSLGQDDNLNQSRISSHQIHINSITRKRENMMNRNLEQQSYSSTEV